MPTATFAKRLIDSRNRYLGSLPACIEAIAESLRERLLGGIEVENVLDGQLHTLAGTAGSYGLFAIAEAATEAEAECAVMPGIMPDGHARYLWSLVEELQDAVAMGVGFDVAEDSVFFAMHPAVFGAAGVA